MQANVSLLRDMLITDKLDVANRLNNFFITIATTLVKMLLFRALWGKAHASILKILGVREDDFKLAMVITDDVF